MTALKFYATVQTLCRRRDGATAIEYSLIAGLIALAIIVGVTSIGTSISSTFNKVANGFN